MNMINRLLVSLTLLAAIFTTAAPDAAEPAVAEPAIWIDVRSADEYAAGHIAGAINIPHGEIAERIGEVTQNKHAHIKLYCRSGRRSGIALEALQLQGFDNLSNEGGYQQILLKQQQAAQQNSSDSEQH